MPLKKQIKKQLNDEIIEINNHEIKIDFIKRTLENNTHEVI